MSAGKPWNDEPDNLPMSWTDLVADYRASAEWSRKEASLDDCHPDDRDRYENEAAQWDMAASILEEAAAVLSGRFYTASRSQALKGIFPVQP